MRWANQRKPAVLIDLLLALPVERGAIAAHHRWDVQAGARTTARFPSLTVKRVRAVSAQQPRIVQGNDGWHQPAELRQLSEIKIIPVKVVQVQDVGSERRLLQQVSRTGEGKVFMPSPPRPEPLRRCQAGNPAFGYPLRPANAAGEMIHMLSRGHPEPPPHGPVTVLFDHAHARPFAGLTANQHSGFMPCLKKRPMQGQADAGGSAPSGLLVDMKNLHSRVNYKRPLRICRRNSSPSQSRTTNRGIWNRSVSRPMRSLKLEQALLKPSSFNKPTVSALRSEERRVGKE